MSKANTPIALLIVAIQDLFDAEQAWDEHLASLEEHVGDAGLRRFVSEQRARSKAQGERLAGIARAFDTPPRDAANIWLRAILDDAGRDTRTISGGALLDIALVGAFRKGIQAERVSYETAVGLGDAIDNRIVSAMLVRSRDEEADADRFLADLLNRLCASIGTAPYEPAATS